jgi:hypothetical protein
MSLLDKGGNHQLHEYFERFGLNSEPINVKYNTVAAHYYRRILSALAS